MARRHAAKRPKQQDTGHSKVHLYGSIILSWAFFIFLDYVTGLRFEYFLSYLYTTPIITDLQVQSSWTFARAVTMVVLVDTLCYLLLPYEAVLFLASSYIWAYLVWDLGPRWLPSLTIFGFMVYFERFHRLPPTSTMCRPLAAHSIGFPLMVVCRDLPACLALWVDRRRRKHVRERNDTVFSYVLEAAVTDSYSLAGGVGAREEEEGTVAAVVGHPSDALPAPTHPPNTQPPAPSGAKGRPPDDSKPDGGGDCPMRRRSGPMAPAAGPGPPNPATPHQHTTPQAPPQPSAPRHHTPPPPASAPPPRNSTEGVNGSVLKGGREGEGASQIVFLMGCLKDEQQRQKEAASQLQRAERDVLRLRATEAQLRGDLSTVRQAVLQLEAEVDKMREARQQAKALGKRKDDEKRAVERQLDKATKDLKRVEGELRALQQAKKECDTLAAERLKKTREGLERDLQRERERCADQQAQAQRADEQQRQAADRLRIAEARAETLEKELGGLRATLARANEERDRARGERDGERERAQRERDEREKEPPPAPSAWSPVDGHGMARVEEHMRALQDKNAALQHTLAAETKFKMDLMAELSRAQREIRALKGQAGLYPGH